MPSLVLAAALFVTIQAPAAAPPTAAEVKLHARAALALPAAQDFPALEAQFTDTMKAALPGQALQARWTALQGRAGAFKGCGEDARVRAIAGPQMVIVPREFARAPLDVQFAFDSENRISGLVFRPAAPELAYALPAYAAPSAYSEADVIVGSGEWQAPGTLSLPAGVTLPECEHWKATLAGRRDVTFRSYPALNHLFTAGTGKSLPAEYQVPAHVAEPVVTCVATWINKGPGQ